MVTLLSRTIGKGGEQPDVFHYPPLPNFKTTPCPSVVGEEDEDGTLWRRFDEVGCGGEEKREKLVCVTSGTSYLGSAIVDRLLSRGYSVRIAVSNQAALDGFMLAKAGRRRLSGTVVDVGDVESLCAAFRECHGVFHTSSFTDPAGLSGYSKQMAEWERVAVEAVVSACARTASVSHCVFTSSLLACIWRPPPPPPPSRPLLIDESSWSDESICSDKKLWMALGKTMAEKAAWRAAEANGVALSTLCPGLITGPAFSDRNPSASLAYLKGGKEMFGMGVLAVADVRHAAEAHLWVYEAMERGVRGRFICFDSVVSGAGEAARLGSQLQHPAAMDGETAAPPFSYRLCNHKLSMLTSLSV